MMTKGQKIDIIRAKYLLNSDVEIAELASCSAYTVKNLRCQQKLFRPGSKAFKTVLTENHKKALIMEDLACKNYSFLESLSKRHKVSLQYLKELREELKRLPFSDRTKTIVLQSKINLP